VILDSRIYSLVFCVIINRYYIKLYIYRIGYILYRTQRPKRLLPFAVYDAVMIPCHWLVKKDLGLYNGLHLLNFTTVVNLYATNLRSCVCVLDCSRRATMLLND